MRGPFLHWRYEQANLDRIPEELRNRRQWVAWKNMPERGKVPMVAGLQKARWASTTDPDTWRSFEDAVQSLSWADGIGCVFSPDHPYTGIDLDEHRDPETGELDDIARSFLDQLESYAEVSPSGRHGVRNDPESLGRPTSRR